MAQGVPLETATAVVAQAVAKIAREKAARGEEPSQQSAGGMLVYVARLAGDSPPTRHPNRAITRTLTRTLTLTLTVTLTLTLTPTLNRTRTRTRTRNPKSEPEPEPLTLTLIPNP